MAAACCVAKPAVASANGVALVTGATGFVGGHLVRCLATRGIEVHAVVRRAMTDPAVMALSECAAIHYHDGHTSGLAEIVETVQPDIAYHLAARFVAEHGAEDLEKLVHDNLLFGVQLLDAMRSAHVTRFVTAGSAWQHYGNADYSPVNLYAATKQAFGALLQYYVEAHGIHAVTLELTDSYGHGDTRRRLIPFMLEAERLGNTMSMVHAELPLDFVHVSDVAEAFVIAGERVANSTVAMSEVFAVRSGAPLPVRELFAAWERSRGVEIQAKWGERAVREREVLDPWTQGKVLPGWAPRVSLEHGLRAL